MGFRAGLPQLEIKLSIADAQHSDLLAGCEQGLRNLVGDYIIGSDSTTLASAVIDLLKGRNKQLTTAESCTGGLIAANITAVAGASAVFEAGFVTYSNAMKTAILDVDEALLEKHGAVSEEVVAAMFSGALKVSKADYGIAVSGIAGPEGDSDEKPVGTAWLALGDKGQR